jgi:cardiolipin synthase
MLAFAAIADWEAWLIHFRLAVVVSAHVLAFSLVAVHCLHHRREPTSALLWIFVTFTFPFVGALLFLAFGVNRVQRKGWRKHVSDQAFLSERRRREEEQKPLAYWRALRKSVAAEPASPLAHDLNTALNAMLTDYPLIGGNRIEPLVDGDEAFPSMLKAIESARDHVHLQTFIVGNDCMGRRFLDLLRQKAEAGVKVRFLYDRFGSAHALLGGLLNSYGNVPNLRLVGWTQANPLKRQFQFNLRNHRKVLIVDGQRAFTGGINLSANNVRQGERPPDRDYHFALEGPIVQELQYAFLSDLYFMSEETPDALLSEKHFPPVQPAGAAPIRAIVGGPTADVETLTDVLFAAIVSARKHLVAVTPYFVPTLDILRALRSAALRGVDVRLVLPRENNHRYAGLAGRALYDELLSAGVHIFERRPPFMHAKALIVDDAVAIVGSANLDVRSLRLNYETNLAVFDGAFIDAMKRLAAEEISMSEEIDQSAWRQRPGAQRLAENFCNLLTPIL